MLHILKDTITKYLKELDKNEIKNIKYPIDSVGLM